MRIVKKMCMGFKVVQLKNGKFRVKDEWNYTIREESGKVLEFVFIENAIAFVKEQQRKIGGAVKVN